MRSGPLNKARVRFGSAARAGLFAATLATASVNAANILTNPGFEADINGGSQNLVAWTRFGANTYSESGATAHSGSHYFKLYQAFNGAVNNTGIYQDVLSGPGAAYSAQTWAYTASSDAIAGQNLAWAVVTFRDTGGNILALYRSTQVSAAALSSGAFPRNSWTLLAITNQCDPAKGIVTNHVPALIAPANTSFARFQIVFQGDANNSAGSMYFDDLALDRIDGAPYGNWNIVWSDEFNGSALNPQVWTYETGGGGWGNKELEYYTSSPSNVSVSGGLLHITAQKQSLNGYNYTSARIKTEGLYSKLYGRFEWRAKLPGGVGFWPALWMLGENFSSVGWPGCGEIDVVENNGTALTNVQGSLHSGTDETAIDTLPEGSVTDFHTYTLDWTSGAVSWFIDGLRYQTQTNWGSSRGSYPAPFDAPFFFIINLAIGGNYVGNPTPAQINASTFPGELQVDYLRVFDITSPLQLTATDGNHQINLSWPTNIVCHLQSAPSPTGPWTDRPPVSNPYTVASGPTTFYRLASP